MSVVKNLWTSEFHAIWENLGAEGQEDKLRLNRCPLPPISPGGKGRDKRLYVSGFFILAGPLMEREMFLDCLRKAQGPEGFHDQGKTSEGSEENLG